MQVHNSVIHSAYLVGMTLISTAIIYLSFDTDTPITRFAFGFGCCLLGHVLTEALNDNEVEE